MRVLLVENIHPDASARLTEIGSEYSEDVLAELRDMPATIRPRTLRSR